ncbi:MAG: pilus assembly protein PilM [Lentisphaeria bacterium]|nr:pilus assembly protein PilM [Lentisphaeria bacterium]
MAKKDNSILAVDIGGGCLKMAEFSFPESGGVILERYGFKDMGDRETDMGVAFAEAYTALLEEIPFQANRVRLSISGQVSFSRLSPLPKLSGNSGAIAKVVEFEAGQVVPYPMNEVVWGYQLLSHTKRVEHVLDAVIGETAPQIEVEEVEEFEALFVAAKNDQVSMFTDTILASGKEILSVDIAPLSMFNAAKASQLAEVQESILLLNIGARCTSLVITEGNRVFVRNIPIAGDTVTAQIAKEFGISFNEAEDLKRRHGFVALGGGYAEPESEVAATISKIARNIMTRLHGEINRSVSVWRSQHGGTAPRKMLLSGGGSLMFYTKEFFVEKLRYEVDYLNVFSAGVGLGDEIDRNALVEVAPLFSEMVGVILREVITCPVDISLVPKAIRFQQEFSRKKPFFYITAAMVVFCLGAVLMAMTFRANYSESMVSATQGEVAKTIDMKEKINNLNGTRLAAKSEYEEALSFVDSRKTWIKLLMELQTMMPDNMWLAALEGQGTEVKAPVEEGTADGMDLGMGGMDMMMMADDMMMGEENPEEKKEDYTIRKNAKETVEVAELRLRFYTLTMPNDDMAEEKFRQAFQKSEFFQNDKEGFSILSYDGGSGKSKDNLKSFVVLVKLKEPLKK